MPDESTTWNVPDRVVDRKKFQLSRTPRIQRLYMLAQVNGCEKCGWSEHKEVLELHHMNGKRSDGSRENLRLWCPNCHQSYHFETKTGQFDSKRYEKANVIKKALGIETVGRGLARSALQQVMDKNPHLVN
jgi:5-methylcytosine-specific restriction endonuclease McrA